VSGIRERRDLTPKQKDKILGLNAAKLLKLYQLAGGAFSTTGNCLNLLNGLNRAYVLDSPIEDARRLVGCDKLIGQTDVVDYSSRRAALKK